MTVEDTGEVTLILENHRCEPTSLEEGLILGNVQEISEVIEWFDESSSGAGPQPEISVNAFFPLVVRGSVNTESS